MPNTLVISTRFRAGKYEVHGEVKAGSDLPAEIFIYEKDDKGGLADYVGIALPKDMAKLKVYNPDKKSNFGSRYTLYKEGLVKANSPQEQINAANHMKGTFKMLVDQYSADSADEVEEYEL